MNNLIESLGFFHPENIDRRECWQLEEAFKYWLGDTGKVDTHQINHVLFRKPSTQFSALDLVYHPRADAQDWHRDNNTGNYDFPLIIWSNHKPTEVLLPNGTITHGRCNEVMMVDNGKTKHRTPKMSLPTAQKRMFARAYLRPQIW